MKLFNNTAPEINDIPLLGLGLKHVGGRSTFLLKDFENYSISSEGFVYSYFTKKIRKGVILKNGYVTVLLRKERKYHCRYVHRLVATAFIPNPENKCCVNHKNGIKTDNRVENLEWCTASENIIHSYNHLNHKIVTPIELGQTGSRHHLSESICQISPDGFLINVFGSCREASRETKIPKTTILKCRKNKTEYAGGYIWK